MIFFKRKIKENPLCDKCSEEKEDLSSRYCTKCDKISLSYILPINYFYIDVEEDFKDVWFYVWSKSIDERGLAWFKKARKKIIEQLIKYKEEEKNIEERKIKKWLNL